MGAGLAAKNSELVLQASDVETAGVQKVCRTNIVLDRVILDLEGDGSGIVIGLTVVGHRHDAGLEDLAVNSKSRVAGRS